MHGLTASTIEGLCYWQGKKSSGLHKAKAQKNKVKVNGGSSLRVLHLRIRRDDFGICFKSVACEKIFTKVCRVDPTCVVGLLEINDLGGGVAGFIRMFRLSEVAAKLAPLSEASQLVYWMLLDTADWRFGRVLITQEVIADSLAKSVRTIERATKELIKAGLVRHTKGIYAINPEFAWGGRSWNIPKAAYHGMGGKTAQVISFKDMAQAMNEEALERVGRETLREVSARKSKGPKAC